MSANSYLIHIEISRCNDNLLADTPIDRLFQRHLFRIFVGGRAELRPRNATQLTMQFQRCRIGHTNTF
jgi:hypothetical protein